MILKFKITFTIQIASKGDFFKPKHDLNIKKKKVDMNFTLVNDTKVILTFFLFSCV